MLKRTLALLVVCAATSSNVAAQTAAESRVFVEAAGFANRGWYSITQPSSQMVPDVSGTSAGGSATIGTFLTPRFSVRFEFAAVADLNASATSTARAGTSPLAPMITDGANLSQRERTAAVLVGYHTPRHHRVELSYLGGAVFVFSTQKETVTETVLPVPIGYVPQQDSLTVRSYGATVEVGMDADIAVLRHLSVVPQARILADGVSVRPGVALRARW